MGDEPRSISVRGIKLGCKHCGRDLFLANRGQLTTPLKNFLNLEWAGPTADVFICTTCGFLHWFMEQDSVEYLVEDPMDVETECLSCRNAIPAGSDKCPDAGGLTGISFEPKPA